MGVYRMKLAGREEPILLRAKGRPEAVARVVEEAKALTAEEVEDAFASGKAVWRDGEPFPAEISPALRRLVDAARAIAHAESSTVSDERSELVEAVDAYADAVPYADE